MLANSIREHFVQLRKIVLTTLVFLELRLAYIMLRCESLCRQLRRQARGP